MTGVPAEGPKGRAPSIQSRDTQLPEVVQWGLRFAAGLSILVNIELLSGVAFAIKGTRALLGLPEPGVPRRAAFRLDPRPACDTAPTKDDDASESSDGASDSDDSQPRAAASIYIDIAASPLAKAKGELAPPSPGAPRLIEVEHIKVDAAQGADSEAWRVIGPYMRLYGSGALSSSTLWNPEFTHMFVPGVGSQAYFIGQAYNRTIVVGINDPLAHPDHWAEMAATFSRVFPGATYTHVGPRFAQVLKDTQGYTINDAGAETNIQVQKFNYSKRTRTIRNGARDARAAGVSVRELRAKDLTPETCQQLKAVTGDWLELKTVKEEGMRVYIRHIDYDNLQLAEGVRLFVAEAPSGAAAGAGGAAPKAVCGFVLVDPMFRDGAVYGYVTSVNRMLRGSHPGVLKLMYDDIMAVMKREGKEVLTFGFSPFFNVQKTPFCGAWWAELSMRFCFHFANSLYGFKNLAFSKARYGGGVVGDAYHDPNVTMTHVYGATWAKAVPDMALLDNYILMMTTGFTGNAVDAFFKLARWSARPKGAAPGADGDTPASDGSSSSGGCSSSSSSGASKASLVAPSSRASLETPSRPGSAASVASLGSAERAAQGQE